ncbi:MAG: GMC family oxidoreductase [Acidobacteriota bacterium]|nr:GMC family oxidoreductase [Acidobacteriota bacterium]
MISDMRTIPRDATLEADVCIIGGGAAGIAIAREFIDGHLKVILLESGGLHSDSAVQKLYAGHSVGEPYYKPLDECRSRYFGGSTNCWGAIFRPFDAIDFDKRSWVPLSGWPVSYKDIRPWLRQAHAYYGAGPFIYDASAWSAAQIPPAGVNPEMFSPMVWHFNSRADTVSFGRRFRNELRAASNVHVLLNANATDLLTNESGRVVERLRARTLDGKVRHIRARTFVMACGGIENARLLLASTGNGGTQGHGLGNERDLVGRYFHEHLEMPIGFLVNNGDIPRGASYSRLHRLGATFCLPGLALPPSVQAARRTLNAALSVDPIYDRESALIAFQNLRSSLKAKRVTPGLLRQLWKLCAGGNKLAPEAWRRVVQGDRPQGEPDKFFIFARAEQAPNRDSRVKLAADTDPLGMPRACLDWRTNELDRAAFKLMIDSVASEFPRLGLGNVIANPWPEDSGWLEGMVGGPHHMGTTRMSGDPATGVVDRNCRVHGLAGLYVAGSSVFPTGGHANPTLTILAFALRLASHLRENLASPASVAAVETAHAPR